MAETLHIGRKIARIRELRGMKQEALASELGISQQAVSKIEQSDKIEEEVLEKLAVALGVSPDAIKNYSDEAVIYNIQNNYEGSTLNHSSNYQYNHACTFNPIEKVVELYERLLTAEREKSDMLKSNK